VVENLGRLYDYCAGRLYTAGVALDPPSSTK
jgi:flagellar protein FliS